MSIQRALVSMGLAIIALHTALGAVRITLSARDLQSRVSELQTLGQAGSGLSLATVGADMSARAGT